MVSLYLKNYSDAECVALYNALHLSVRTLDPNTEPRKDLESVLDYLTGYMDCRNDKKKEGAKQCPHA